MLLLPLMLLSSALRSAFTDLVHRRCPQDDVTVRDESGRCHHSLTPPSRRGDRVGDHGRVRPSSLGNG